MATKKKLEALLQFRHSEEKSAFDESRRIEDVLDEREINLANLRDAEKLLREEIEALGRRVQEREVLGVGAKRLGLLKSYEKRLRKELSALTQRIEKQEADVVRARERAEMAQVDLQDARVERKKLEQLEESVQTTARVLKSAYEEMTRDETASRMKKK